MTRRCSRRSEHVETLPGHNPELPCLFKSLHAIAEIDQQLIGRLEADQTRAWVLNVEHDVDDDDRYDRETEDVQPTPVLAT